MGIEHDRLRDQISGALQGVTSELEQATVLLQEQKERVERLEESRTELARILQHHDRSDEA